jgi:hypothetical protein
MISPAVPIAATRSTSCQCRPSLARSRSLRPRCLLRALPVMLGALLINAKVAVPRRGLGTPSPNSIKAARAGPTVTLSLTGRPRRLTRSRAGV